MNTFNAFSDKPTAPRNLVPKEVTSEHITLTWDKPENDGGVPVTSYILERCEASRRSWTEVKEISEQEYSITKLLENNKYFFRVSAKNDVGVSEPVDSKQITAKNPFGKLL